MIRRHWNALRVGNHVLVHDDDDPQMTLAPGRVMKIDQTAGSHSVTIRISPRKGRQRDVQPSRLAVHLDTGEGTERCWRCETHYP